MGLPNVVKYLPNVPAQDKMGLPNAVKYLPNVPAHDKMGLPNAVKYLPNVPAKDKTGSPNAVIFLHWTTRQDGITQCLKVHPMLLFFKLHQFQPSCTLSSF
jgi:hypothetical protein